MATASSTVATPVSTSSSAAPASTSQSFVWQPVAEMFTCGQTNVRWAYTGSSTQLTLNITNINVSQQAPLSSLGPSSTPQTSASAVTASVVNRLVKRQFNGFGGSYLPTVDVIIIAGIDPAANNFTWTSVNVPQGWYQLYANVQNTVQATSSSFYVQNGTNINCVPQYVAGVPVPSTAANSSSTSRIPASTGSPSSAQSGHSHAGAIAGGVVGGVAFLATVFAAIIFCFLRRRPSRSRRGYEDGGGRRWSFRKLRSGNNTSRSSVQKTSPNLQAEQTIIGSDEEISTVGHEKLVAVAQASHPPQQPTRSQSLRTSAQTTASYRDGRATTNPERPGSRASYGAHPGETIPLEHTHLQHSPSLSVTSPRRKPAPRYDGAAEAEERAGRSSSQSTLDPIHGDSAKGSPDSVHILQHKSSFGAVRPMRVMITDPPTCAPP